MRTARRCCQAAALALVVAARTSGVPGVTWRPERPLQGSLALLVVHPESLGVSAPEGSSPRGTAAGEPLHFEAMPGGGSWSLVPVPLDAGDTLDVAIAIAGDSLSLRVPVAPLVFGSERLRPPAEFRRLPDSSVVARTAAESESINVVLEHSHATPRLWREAFLRPVPGRVNSKFGARRAFAEGLVRRHRGADLAAAQGRAVVATNRGVVALVGDYYYGGRTVMLDHGGGLVTAYEHLSSAAVAVGDTVARGAIIGRVGSTGRATGPHLHWAAFYGRVAVDPLQLLTIASTIPEM